MAENAAGKAGSGSGPVEPEGAGQPAAPDNGGDGALQPGQAHADVGEEKPGLRLRQVKVERGGQKMNQLTGELEVWKETQYYDVEEEGHED